MPPKGWRKNADGAYPATSKERDSISIEDILFPKATVNRLAKAILPDDSLISKDSSTALQRSSTLFVSYLLVHARSHAKNFDRKTIGPQDILAALQSAEFSSFIPSVKAELNSFQARKDAIKLKKKEEKAEKKTATDSSNAPDGEASTVTEANNEGNTSNNSNETVDENDDYATTNENPDEEDDEVEKEGTEEPQTKKAKN